MRIALLSFRIYVGIEHFCHPERVSGSKKYNSSKNKFDKPEREGARYIMKVII